MWNGAPDSLSGKVALNGGKAALRARNIQYEQYTNGNLYIGIDNGDELYADLTVNLDIPLPPNQAYVDVNNFPEAESFIQEREVLFLCGKGIFSAPLALRSKWHR